MSIQAFQERPAAGAAEGLLVLHHGRGADEHDLLALAGVLDPGRALHVVAPRAPLTLPGSPGHHWYLVPRVGHPDQDTFHAAFAALAGFHDALWERTGLGPEQTILGGFSMGAVMSYSLGLASSRPRPAGVLPSPASCRTSPAGSPTSPGASACRCSSPTAARTRSSRSISRAAPARRSRPVA